jgi:hypothetical protein
MSTTDRSLVVLDGGNASLSVFDEGGSFQKRIQLGAVTFSILGLRGHRILASQLQGDSLVHNIVSLTTGTAREVQIPDLDAVWPDAHRNGSSVPCTSVYGSGDNILVLSCYVPTFQVVDAQGALKRFVTVAVPPQRATDSELEYLTSSVGRNIAEVGLPALRARLLDQAVQHFAVKPLYRGIRFDERARTYAIWAQNPAELGGGGVATLAIVTEAGKFLASIAFPTRWVDFDISQLSVYALTEDPDTGIRNLVRYDILLPPEATPFVGVM